MNQMRQLIAATVLIAALAVVPDAYAHRPEPGSKDGVTVIPNPTTSYAYYREILEPMHVHVYQFDAEAGQFFHAGINIPQITGLEDFGVTLALLGPGLPSIAEEQPHSHDPDDDPDHHAVPSGAVQVPVADLEIDAGTGLVAESVTSEEFYEPFTQTHYWGRQIVEMNLPQSGTYYILIWNPEGHTGKYVLDTGTEEVFGPTDLLRFPIWWLNTRVYFEQTPQLVGVLMIVLTGAIGLIVYRRKR